MSVPFLMGGCFVLCSARGAACGILRKVGLNVYMEELIVSIVKGLVDDKDNITVTKDDPDAEGVIVYHINVAPGDMGRVIGKQGRIAKAIRTVVRAASAKSGEKSAVEID